MSDDLWVVDPETEHRRRAVWGLVILALAAVIVVALMIFFIGSSGSDNSGLPFTSQIPERSTTAASTQHSSAHSSSHSTTSSSPSSSASTTATAKCSSGSSSCTLEGDAGGVIAAINAFRRSNGQPPVSGTTTEQAKTCSLNYGDGDCPSSYFWEPVSPQDGAAVVQKIASRSDGRSFLLSPSMTDVQIGWAYVGGQYSCTIATT